MQHQITLHVCFSQVLTQNTATWNFEQEHFSTPCAALCCVYMLTSQSMLEQVICLWFVSQRFQVGISAWTQTMSWSSFVHPGMFQQSTANQT